MNLAVADIIYTTFSLPGIVLTHTNSHPGGVTGKVLCIVLTKGIFAWVGAFSSVLTLNAIAIERYLSVIQPLGSKANLTMRRVKVSCTSKTLQHLASVISLIGESVFLQFLLHKHILMINLSSVYQIRFEDTFKKCMSSLLPAISQLLIPDIPLLLIAKN